MQLIYDPRIDEDQTPIAKSVRDLYVALNNKILDESNLTLKLLQKKVFYTVGIGVGDYICDGTADDVQVQQAIDAAYTAGGGIVQLPVGTLNFADTVLPKSNVTIQGYGMQATILTTSSTGYSIFTKTTSDTTLNIIIRDMTIDGNSKTGGKDSEGLLHIGTVTDATLERVEARNGKYNGIYFGSDCTRVKVRDCYSHDHGDTAWGHGFVFWNKIRECSITNSISHNNRMNGIWIGANLPTESAEYNDHIIVANNITYNNTIIGIYVDSAARHTTVENNISYNNVAGNYFVYGGDDITARTTTLSSILLIGATTIPMTTTANFQSAGKVKIENEVISYTGLVTDTSLTGCTRAQDGTSAAEHASGSTVTFCTAINDGDGITAADTTITVDSTAGFPYVNYPTSQAFLDKASGFIKIDSEEIYYKSKTLTAFTNCVRGANGTTEAAHDDNDVVTVTTGYGISDSVNINNNHSYISYAASATYAHITALYTGDKISITNNTCDEIPYDAITHASSHGIYVLNANGIGKNYIITGNNVYRGNQGLLLYGLTSGLVTNNNIYESALNGIYINRCPGLVVKDNYSRDSNRSNGAASGIIVIDDGTPYSTDLEISRNKVYDLATNVFSDYGIDTSAMIVKAKVENNDIKGFVTSEYNLDALHLLGDSGWRYVPATWFYASASTITVPSNATKIYNVGDKIAIYQSGWKYFYITAVAATVLTVRGDTVANAAIEANYYSKDESPLGFPDAFNYTPTGVAGSNVTLAGRYSLKGNICSCRVKATFTGAITFTTMPTLPITASANILGADPSGFGGYVDSGTTSAPLGIVAQVIASATTVGVLKATDGSDMSASNPITWANGDTFIIDFSYEI